MRLISHKIFLQHDNPSHPECAERIKKALSIFPYDPAINGEEHLTRVHTHGYILKIKTASKEAEDSFRILDSGDTYICKETYEVACYAVGASIQAADCAIRGEPAFALVRPPGHHAHPDRAYGFCIFNNMAIAAAYLAEQGNRILIVDIDLHRGDGTADCISRLNKRYKNAIHYFSMNQHGVFPGEPSDESNVTTNIDVTAGTAEDAYLDILKEQLIQLKHDFKPTVIAVSAGFDSFVKDKETHGFVLRCDLNLTNMTIFELKKLIDGTPYFAVLEGGYNPDSIVEGVNAFLAPTLHHSVLGGAKADYHRC